MPRAVSPWHVVSCGLCVGRQRAEVEELRRQLEASSLAVTTALKEEYAREKEEQERRHQVCCSSVPWELPVRAGRKQAVPCILTQPGAACMELRAGTLWAPCTHGMREGRAQLYPVELSSSLPHPSVDRSEGAEGPTGARETGLGGQLCEEGGNSRGCLAREALPSGSEVMFPLSVAVPRKPGCSPGSGS